MLGMVKPPSNDTPLGLSSPIEEKTPSKLSAFRLVELVFLAVVGTIFGVMLFGTTTLSSGPFSAELSIKPSLHGKTVIDLGPLGKISFQSHRGPLIVDVKLSSISPETASKFLKSTNNFKDYNPDLSGDLKKSFRNILLNSILSGLIASFLIILIAFRRWRIAVYGAFISLLFNLIILSTAFATYKPEAISQPKYQGLVTAAPTLIGSAKDISANFSLYRDQMAKLITNVSAIYSMADGLPANVKSEDTIAVLHISDLHLNPEGWDLVDSLVKQFNVDIIVDTGDISDHGTSIEDYFLAHIASYKIPYLYIRGNHDSQHTQEVISSFSNAVVLDKGSVRTVGGLTFAGYGDIRFTPDKSKDNVPDLLVLASGENFASNIAGKEVDVAMIHDPQIAPKLDGLVPLVLAGHHHQQKLTILSEGTLLRVEGSTGGSGLRALSNSKTATPLQASILYFDKKTHALTSFDEVTMGGMSNPSVVINRKIVEQFKK